MVCLPGLQGALWSTLLRMALANGSRDNGRIVWAHVNPVFPLCRATVPSFLGKTRAAVPIQRGERVEMLTLNTHVRGNVTTASQLYELIAANTIRRAVALVRKRAGHDSTKL